MAEKVIIMGAAGRDFHDFNVFFRNNPDYKIVAFTAAQIPGIAKRTYPKELAGRLYPKGIKIYPEEKLPELIKKYKADSVYLSYSDLSHQDVMHKASSVLSCGADFKLLGSNRTFLRSRKPVVAVCATRTGCGKSQTTRMIAQYFKDRKKKVVIIRHPMPYGDLVKQAVQRFETYADLDKYGCTIEEREEYEHHLDAGFIVYAGVDYERILRSAEKEADIILWDGGNNDTPFYKPDLHIVIADPHRAGHEISYHPGETNLRMADVIVINKIKSATKENIDIVKRNIKDFNPKAEIVMADSRFIVTTPNILKNKKVIVVEDGPTITHGGMSYGAGYLAAQKYGAKIIDPVPYLRGELKQTFDKYAHIKKVVPAMGYSKKQRRELQDVFNNAKCDLIVSATPIKLTKLLKLNKKVVHVSYELDEKGKLGLSKFLVKLRKKK